MSDFDDESIALDPLTFHLGLETEGGEATARSTDGATGDSRDGGLTLRQTRQLREALNAYLDNSSTTTRWRPARKLVRDFAFGQWP